MKINTFQLIATLIAICFLFGMVFSIEAGEITSLSAEQYMGEYARVTVTADADIDYVLWYTKQIYPYDYRDTDFNFISSNMYNRGTRTVYLYVPVDGNIKVAEHEIKVRILFYDGEFDTAITTAYITKPEYAPDPDKKLNVDGYAVVNSHTYDRWNNWVTMDASSYVRNREPKPVDGALYTWITASTRFRHEATNGVVQLQHEEDVSQALKNEQSITWHTSDWQHNFSLGITVGNREDLPLDCTTYVRCQALGNRNIMDEWFVGFTTNFTWWDDHRDYWD